MKKLLLLSVLFLFGMLVQAQTCSAPISMTIMNGNMYRFYTDTVPGIQSYAWIVTTFEDDTATSTGSFSSTPSAYFSGNEFISPDYVEACLTLTFEDGCVASSCDTFVYCDAGFTYALNEQYALTLTPDFPAGYMNELHYWTVSGPGIPNPTQNTEIATYYVEPGATYTVCQQLMITSSGCNTSECQVITIPDTEAPVCDAAFTYYYQPTNAYFSVNSPYTNAQGSFEHTWEVTSYMNNGTVNTNNQLNVNNNSMFVASNTNALEICHTLTNLNTGCVDSSCQYLDFCSSEYTYAIDTNNQVMTLTAGGVQTLATHTWNIAYHAAGGIYDSETLTGSIATFLLPDGILDLTICHSVNNTGPYINCTSYACDTIVFCNAEFAVIDNGNGTAGIWAVSPPIDGAVYTWSITGPGYAGTAYSGSYFNFTPVPNEPYYVCMAYFNAETGCSASNCDTIVVEGISDTCSAEFTYTYNNSVLLAQATTPYFSGNMYSWTVQSTVYGTLANIQDSGPYATITIPPDAGTVYIFMNLTNEFYECNSTFFDTLLVTPDTSCAAEIVMGYAPSGWPMFSANGNSTIASYSWILTPYDSNGQALGSGFFSTQNNAYIPAGTTFASIEACLAITTASGCAWNGCATFTAPPDTVISVNCDAFCAFEILPSPDSATAMLVNIFFNGASNSSINNSFVSAITTLSGDTLAMGPENFYAQMGGTQQLYPVYAIDGNTIPNNFNGYVHFSYDNQTCILPYQCLPVCNAAFSWVNNGNNTITATQNGYAPGGQYSWTLTNVVSGQILTYTDSVYITLQLVPGQLYSLCLSYSNEAANCSNSWCAEVSIPQNIPCNADFTYSGPLPINNSYQFIGVPNNDNAYHLWTFGDGASSEQEYPFHAYDTIGVYTVCHIVSVDGVCADTICITIQATENPACTAEIVMGYAPDGWPMFSAIGGSEIATYNWILSPFDSNGIGYNGTYFYSTQNNAYVPAGTEYVGVEGCLSVTFTNGCAWNGCATFTAPPDTANTLPCNALFTFTGPLPVDNNYQFIGVTNDESAYHVWTFSDGASSSQVSPFHAFATTGVYTVCHIVGINGVCADTICYTGNFIGNSTTGLFIAGEVNAGANVPDNGKVKLYTIDTLSNSVSLVAEYTLSNSGNYIFNGLEAGIYLIKAGLTQGSAWYGDYVPTYFGSQFYWFDAELVYLTQSGENYDIALIYAGNGGGPGSVGGTIDDGPFRLMDAESAGVANANPVAGADVIVTDLNGNPQRWIDADNSGNFSITNLDYGTYRLLADEPGMTCVPVEFTISPEFPSVFIELVMGEELTGIDAASAIIALGEVYPNPAQNNAIIKINSSSTDNLVIQVSSLDGKVIYNVNQAVSDNASFKIPSSSFSAGLYIVTIRSEEKSISLSRKLQVLR
jgi:hypothetical protein